MIQTDVSLPERPDIEVLHIEPDQLPYVCVRESLERRVDNTISWPRGRAARPWST